ncbi:hypothetical protein GH5_06433 [Leishmania sp. Ghana 2012 LV757]|uniref:hypothetical protein n=1 Tax=Leishmania sp. Ghana 2012 LV757 TaxID=2803181 RepID=UPI001B72B142|nr:hypothetical protein GH5_06433 [Leishmania sp. Ghana 2012 LV757]
MFWKLHCKGESQNWLYVRAKESCNAFDNGIELDVKICEVVEDSSNGGNGFFFDFSSTTTLTNVIHGEHNYESGPCRSRFNSKSRNLPQMAQGNIEKHTHDNLASQRLLKRKQSNADITIENPAAVALLYKAYEKNPFTALLLVLIGDRGMHKRGGRTEVDQYAAIGFV